MMTTRTNMSTGGHNDENLHVYRSAADDWKSRINELYKRLRCVPRASADPTNFAHLFKCIT